MRTASAAGLLRHNVFAVLTGLAVAAPALADSTEPRTEAATNADYSLVDARVLSPTRWLPLDRLTRFDVAAGLAPRHEVRLRAALTPHDAIALGGDRSITLSAPRATYRYTLMERSSWSWKVGLSSNLREAADVAHPVTDTRTRFDAVPLVHMAGEAQLTNRWQLALDADGVMTTRGRSLDIGMRVNYRLSPSFALYGGWRLSEIGGDAEELHTPGLSGAANVGVRWRF